MGRPVSTIIFRRVGPIVTVSGPRPLLRFVVVAETDGIVLVMGMPDRFWEQEHLYYQHTQAKLGTCLDIQTNSKESPVDGDRRDKGRPAAGRADKSPN